MTDVLEGDDDFKDAKVGGHVGAILFGGFGMVFVLLLAGAILFTIFGTGDNGSARLVAAIFIPALALCAGVFCYFAWWSLRKLRMWQRLETRPVTAWGTLGEFRPSPTKINTRRLYVFSVTVTPTGGAPYEAEAKWFFPTDLRSVVVAGTVVAVRADPDNPSKVVIDWPRSRAAWAAASTTAPT